MASSSEDAVSPLPIVAQSIHHILGDDSTDVVWEIPDSEDEEAVQAFRTLVQSRTRTILPDPPASNRRSPNRLRPGDWQRASSEVNQTALGGREVPLGERSTGNPQGNDEMKQGCSGMVSPHRHPLELASPHQASSCGSTGMDDLSLPSVRMVRRVLGIQPTSPRPLVVAGEEIAVINLTREDDMSETSSPPRPPRQRRTAPTQASSEEWHRSSKRARAEPERHGSSNCQAAPRQGSTGGGEDNAWISTQSTPHYSSPTEHRGSPPSPGSMLPPPRTARSWDPARYRSVSRNSPRTPRTPPAVSRPSSAQSRLWSQSTRPAQSVTAPYDSTSQQTLNETDRAPSREARGFRHGPSLMNELGGSPAVHSRPAFPRPRATINRHQQPSRESTVTSLPSIGTAVVDADSIHEDQAHMRAVDARITARMAEVQAEDRYGRRARSGNPRRGRVPWTEREVNALVRLVDENGPAWQLIWELNRDGDQSIHLRRSAVDYKDKAALYKRDMIMNGIPLLTTWTNVTIRGRDIDSAARYRLQAAHGP